MNVARQVAGRAHWLVVIGAMLVSGLAFVVVRLRVAPQVGIRLRAEELPLPFAPEPHTKMMPTQTIPQRVRGRPARWLLFVFLTTALVVVLLAMERVYATLLLATVIAVSMVILARRLHMAARAQQTFASRQFRWLVFVFVLIVLALTLLILPRPFPTLVLGTGLASWVAWLLVSTGWVGRAQIGQFVRRAHTAWWAHWTLFALIAAALYGLITGLEHPYSMMALASLLVGTAPLAVAQARPNADLRMALVRGLTLIAVVMAIASAYAVQLENGARFADAWKLLLIGAGALIVAVHQHLQMAGAADLPAPTDHALIPVRVSLGHRWLFWVGLLLMVILAEANGRVLAIPALVYMSSHVQFVTLVLSIGLMTVGIGGVQLRWPSIQWRTVGLVAGLTAIALFLRFWQLDQALRLFVDELNFSDVVRQFWDTPNVPLLEPMSSIAAFPFVYPYWQAHSIELFGRNLIGLRAASAVVGALTIPAVYLMGKALFDRKTALIAALLLATFPPHLHFSRLGLNNIADPLFGTLGIAFIARGLMTSRRVDYALGGALLGLTHYFYEGGRIIFIPVVALWLAGLLILWGPRLRWRNWLIIGLMAMIVALPIYYTLTAIDRPYAARLVDNHMALSANYWRNLLASGFFDEHIRLRVIYPFLTYIQAIEGSFFYRGEAGLILPALVPAFFLGIGYALARLRRPGPMILLLLWLATTLGNSLLVEANQAPRYVLVFPTLMVFVAAGVHYIFPMLMPHYRYLRAVLMVALVVGLGAYQADYYFNRHLIVYNHQMRNNSGHPDDHDAVMRSLNFPLDAQIHLISAVRPDENFTQGFLRFFQ